jgi:hypothetical protein
MNDEIYDDVHIERAIETGFGLKLTITEVVARNVPTSYTSGATFFRTAPNVLYVFIQSEGTMLLADVRKMVRGMNLDAEEYIPPHGDADYFKRIGIEKFKAMFPGKHIMGDDDTRYYQTLAPYSPALVRIERVKGEIRGFQPESKSWRKLREFTYSKISLAQ